MNDAAIASPHTPATVASTAVTAGGTLRYSIYTGVHKGLRAFMADTLVRVSRMDPQDDVEVTQVLEQLRELLRLCRSHLHHENLFMHPALERARPDSALRTADDHVQHEVEIAQLGALADALPAASGVERSAIAHRLYLAVSRFVGENFMHMHVEETDNQAVLAGAYSDEELLALEGAIVPHIDPAMGAIFRRWIIPSLNADERLRTFRNARAHVPPEAFAGMLALARETLSERDWYKLERGLQV